MTTPLRTLTYVVKMDTSDGKEKTKDFRITLKTMEQDASKASIQVNNLAQTIGKKYATNVKIAIDQSKTVANEIKAAAKEASRSERIYNSLSNEYKNLTLKTGKSAEVQEKMNALHRLGAGATLTQKKEIIRLVRAQQAQVKATNSTQKSMRGLRGQAQNLGWQLQDVAVQAQMGTDGLVILGQQGSQLASGFGAMGALIGAGIAVGAAGIGVFSKLMKEVEVDTKVFEERVKSLKGSLDALNDSTFESSREFQAKTLEQVNRELIGLDNNNIKVTKSMTKAAVEYAKFNEFNKAGFSDINKFNKAMSDGQFIIARNTSEIAKLNELKRLQSVANGRSIQEVIDGEKANKELVKSLGEQAATAGLNQRQIDLTAAATRDATIEQISAIAAAHDAIDAVEKQKEALKDKVKSDKEALKELADARKKFESDLSTQAKYDPNIKLSLLQKQYAKERSLLQGNTEALANIDQHYADERIKINGSFWEKYAVSAQENLGSFDDQVSNSLDRFSSGFGDAIANAAFESDNLGEALSNIFLDVGKNMISFFGEWAAQELLMWGLKQTIKAEEVIVNQATNTAVQTSAATTATFNAQAMSIMAGLNAFSSTAAIPIVGPALAPAAMTTAIAATQPLATAVSSLSFAGVFDKGGNIPSGQAGIVSELGDELVGGTMVYNGSQNSLGVTGREDTAKLTKGTNNNFSINSSGAASPEAIARAIMRLIRKGGKAVDNAVFDSMDRGRKNKGKRFA